MSRDRAELNSLFGRAVVESAIARRSLLLQWEWASSANKTEVIKVMQDLEGDCQEFCVSKKS